jgi:sulfotransferase
VPNCVHFISGLPRSGSTLLAALLRQNPAVHAHITSPLGSMVGALLADMSAGNETSVFIDDAQRTAVLRGLFESYYGVHQAGQTVFDTNRGWTTRIDLLAKLFPDFKMICCVRHIPWIIDSVERVIRGNALELSRIFDFDKGGTAYSRADGLMSASGLIGFPLNALKQAMHGAEASRLLLLPYETLVSDPRATMRAIYAFTGLPPFEHDVETIDFDVSEFDARLGTPGLHHVRARVSRVERQTILPPDLWQRYEGASIWRHPDFNTRGVALG